MVEINLMECFHLQAGGPGLSRKLAAIFRHLVKGGNFLAYKRLAVVVLVPKESPFSLETMTLSQLFPVCQRYLRRS